MKKSNEKNWVIVVIISILLIIVCCVGIFFALKYKNEAYEKNHPLLYKVVNKNSDEDKYMEFKGNVDNNYVVYNNLLWRILRVNSSGSMTIILDEPINRLAWQLKDFSLQEYLNKDFKDELDTSKLTKNNICLDTVGNLNKITCENIDDNYVSLLDMNSYYKSLENNQNFIVKDKENIWLASKYDDNNAWHINEGKISHSNVEAMYEVKPVVTLSSGNIYEKGDGTINNPYVITSDNITIGSTVKLGNDLYNVYSTKDNLKLVLKENLADKYKNKGDLKDIISYLEKEFYENLSYKDIIIDNKWQMVNVNQKSVTNEEITSKVSIPNLFDLKPETEKKDYYMLSMVDNYMMVYDNDVIYGTKNSSHNLRPCIVLAKEKMKDFKLQDGIYVLGDL